MPEFSICFAGVDFNPDHWLEVGPGSCFCTFGVSQEIALGHSGHLYLVRRSLPTVKGQSEPLVHWDDEEMAGTSFVQDERFWLSCWLAEFPDWPDKAALEEEREKVAAFASRQGDERIDAVLDAILAGEKSRAKLHELAQPGSLQSRTHALAEEQKLNLERLRSATPKARQRQARELQESSPHLSLFLKKKRSEEEKGLAPTTGDDAWEPLIRENPLYNAPLAYALASGCMTVERAWEWLRRDLKFDVGGSCGAQALTRRVCDFLLEHDPREDSPWWTFLQEFPERNGIAGQVVYEAGLQLAEEGKRQEALVAFENAIYWERSWSERFHQAAAEAHAKLLQEGGA